VGAASGQAIENPAAAGGKCDQSCILFTLLIYDESLDFCSNRSLQIIQIPAYFRACIGNSVLSCQRPLVWFLIPVIELFVKIC
jgi:hypothetical protein